MKEQSVHPYADGDHDGLANLNMALSCRARTIEALAQSQSATQPTQPEIRTEAGYTLTLRVTNAGDGPVRVRFPTSQQFDVVIVGSDGEALWSWSSDRAFLQMVNDRELAPGESVTYEVNWDGRRTDGSACEPGRYRALASFLGETPGAVPVASAEVMIGSKVTVDTDEGSPPSGGNF